MKLGARNKLKGKILDVKKGATGAAIAVVKASDVMIAVD
jgi:molybdopterin-binding protein